MKTVASQIIIEIIYKIENLECSHEEFPEKFTEILENISEKYDFDNDDDDEFINDSNFDKLIRIIDDKFEYHLNNCNNLFDEMGHIEGYSFDDIEHAAEKIDIQFECWPLLTSMSLWSQRGEEKILELIDKKKEQEEEKENKREKIYNELLNEFKVLEEKYDEYVMINESASTMSFYVTICFKNKKDIIIRVSDHPEKQEKAGNYDENILFCNFDYYEAMQNNLNFYNTDKTDDNISSIIEQIEDEIIKEIQN